jgi:hypothetical protein
MAKSVEPRRLCESLLRADTAADVINILTRAGYWDDPRNWRYYGDVENNWAQGGNQQSLAEAALVEKIVNAVDARLLNECLRRGIDPKSPRAPKTIREAVARFFDDSAGIKQSTGGYVEDWSAAKTRDVARGISLCATGLRPSDLSLTISDCGEGQTPDRIPSTILSLNQSNKMYVPFVQGQFNQGGTGALRFCGEDSIQLVVSRRNPALLDSSTSKRDREWGFTVVRRERPSGGRRNSVYTYLAPVGIGGEYKDHHGAILSFVAEKFPIFPEKDGPYSYAVAYGTAIKLYDYKFIGERSNILRGKSVLSRLDLLLPEIALPVRMYECRHDKDGDMLPVGSRETTLLGLRRRLVDNENVEPGFPVSIPFSPQGEKLVAHVFAFKPGGSERASEGDEDDNKPKKKLGGLRGYRKREGILFVRNGQTQGSLPKDFFRRDSLKMKPLADDLLVFVDCDQLSDRAREDLFMPDRERLAAIQFKNELIDQLEQALKSQESLKNLRNRRQQEQMSERVKDDRPLSDVLRQLIKNSPNLTALLQLGQRIPAPFSTKVTGADEQEPFKGEVYPTFFKIKGTEYGKLYERQWPINQRMRLTFETDARDDYFTRRIERGQFSLVWKAKDGSERVASFIGPNLKSGIATVTVTLPDDAQVGHIVPLLARVEDPRASFENKVEATVREEAKPHEPGPPRPPRNPKDKEGEERETSTQLANPHIERVYKGDWEKQVPPFDEFTAMRVKPIGYAGEDDSTEIYSFQVNMDNTPLLNEIKQKRLDDIPARHQFMYANVLIGLSLLLQDKQRVREKNGEMDDSRPAARIEDRIEMTCRALAPFMLALTSLGMEDLTDSDQIDGLEASA